MEKHQNTNRETDREHSRKKTIYAKKNAADVLHPSGDNRSRSYGGSSCT